MLLKRTTATAAAKIFDDFLARFPSFEEISLASEDEIIGTFSKIGLQRQRAKSLRRTANWIITKHYGAIPNSLEALLKTPGLGSYSAAAILSFGFGVSTAIVDTNVERILNRVFLDSCPKRPTRNQFIQTAETLLPESDYREYNYGLLDLGRRVCRYTAPQCVQCPLNTICDFYGVNFTSKRDFPIVGSTRRSTMTMIRKDRGMSLQKLAVLAGLSKNTVIRFEAGKTNPRPQTVRSIARVLGVSPGELIDAPPKD